MKIACLGSSKGEEGEPLYDLMQEVGSLLASEGVEVITGGGSGIGMEAPCRGAFRTGGSTTGYPIMGEKGNAFLLKRVDCQKLSFGKKIPFFADFGIQLSGLMTADAFIVAATGGIEVLIQFMTAVYFNEKFWIPEGKGKRIAVLKPQELWEDPLWTDGMLSKLEEFGFFPETMNPYVCVITTPRAAVDWVHSGVVSAHLSEE